MLLMSPASAAVQGVPELLFLNAQHAFNTAGLLWRNCCFDMILPKHSFLDDQKPLEALAVCRRCQSPPSSPVRQRRSGTSRVWSAGEQVLQGATWPTWG